MLVDAMQSHSAKVEIFRESAMRPIQSTYAFLLEPAVVAAASVLAFFTNLLGPAHGALAVILGFANCLDLTVGGLRAIRDPLDNFDRARFLGGVVGKLMYWAIVFVAIIVEVSGRALLFLLGGDKTVMAIDSLIGSGIVVGVVLFLLIIGEGLSVLDNVSESLGKRIRAIAYLRRLLDAIKWEAEALPIPSEPPLPDRRFYDGPAHAFEDELRDRARGGSRSFHRRARPGQEDDPTKRSTEL